MQGEPMNDPAAALASAQTGPGPGAGRCEPDYPSWEYCRESNLGG
jgi:hypothetical protein